MSSKFVRKVTKSKWNNQLEMKNKVISADAITSCLRTTNNTISVWDVDDVEDAVLALACVNTSIVTIDIVSLKKERLKELSIESNSVKASNNPVIDLVDKHYDIVNLDYDKLGAIANEIAEETINDDTFITRFSSSEVKKILQKAINTGRITKEQLNDELRNKLN